MRILLVIFRADPARGGAERYTIDLAEGLRGRGHEVVIAASEFAEGVEGVLIPAEGVTKTAKYLNFLAKLDQHLRETENIGGSALTPALSRRERGYDVVHAMLPVHWCDVYHPHAGIAAEAIETGHLKHSGIKRPLAKIGNRLNFKRGKFAAVEREMIEGKLQSENCKSEISNCKFSPVVLCLSDYVAGNLRKHYPNARAEKLFNAVDLEKFDPAKRIDAGMNVRRQFGIGANKMVLLMLAQDFERKGLREAMRALKIVDDPQMVLLVAGKEDTSPWKKLASEMGVADRVIFAGATNDPYAFYKAADLFVLPTKHDPCSLVVLEALAMGVPVISTVRNGACEIMTDGVHGSVLADPGDVDALVAAMKKWNDPGRRKTAAELCLQLRPELSYEKHLDRLEEIYRRVIGDGRETTSGE